MFERPPIGTRVTSINPQTRLYRIERACFLYAAVVIRGDILPCEAALPNFRRARDAVRDEPLLFIRKRNALYAIFVSRGSLQFQRARQLNSRMYNNGARASARTLSTSYREYRRVCARARFVRPEVTLLASAARLAYLKPSASCRAPACRPNVNSFGQKIRKKERNATALRERVVARRLVFAKKKSPRSARRNTPRCIHILHFLIARTRARARFRDAESNAEWRELLLPRNVSGVSRRRAPLGGTQRYATRHDAARRVLSTCKSRTASE